MQILIVEDEPGMLAMLSDGLREHGYAVTPESEGDMALALAVSQRFDVIVLDVMLPGMDGYSIARALRHSKDALSRHAPILMLTACDREDQIIHGLDVGADYYMTKPFSFLELLARIKSVRRGNEILKLPVSVSTISSSILGTMWLDVQAKR